jgi:hypothetical protein
MEVEPLRHHLHKKRKLVIVYKLLLLKILQDVKYLEQVIFIQF